MQHSEKLKYMRTATAIVGFAFTDTDLDLLISTYDVVIAKGAGTTLYDLVKIKSQVQERNQKSVVDSPNKQSNS